MLLAAAGSDVQPISMLLLARSHAASTRRNAAQIARLVLQDQDLVLRDLGRVDGDIPERLDEQVAELEARVQAIAETDVLCTTVGEAPTPRSRPISTGCKAKPTLLAQLGDREQMLGRFVPGTELSRTRLQQQCRPSPPSCPWPH